MVTPDDSPTEMPSESFPADKTFVTEAPVATEVMCELSRAVMLMSPLFCQDAVAAVDAGVDVHRNFVVAPQAATLTPTMPLVSRDAAMATEVAFTSAS